MDLIDRAKVESITFQEPSYSDPINVLTEVRDKVRELPTVDAIPVEWIKQFIKKENIDIIHKVGIVYMVEQWKLHPINFEISSEDAIPVIRCKDCKYYDGEYYHYIKGERMRFCKHDMWDGWNEDDFCSYAERKKE